MSFVSYIWKIIIRFEILPYNTKFVNVVLSFSDAIQASSFVKFIPFLEPCSYEVDHLQVDIENLEGLVVHVLQPIFIVVMYPVLWRGVSSFKGVAIKLHGLTGYEFEGLLYRVFPSRSIFAMWGGWSPGIN